MNRIGLLGGTFDPIHQGHLDVAEAARGAIGLTQVLVVPSHIPPHRRAPVASASHRFAMAALATEPHPHLVVSDLEMEDDRPSYTASTLDKLAARGIETRTMFFVIGADAFQEIGSWMDYPAILDRCHFVAVSRPGRPAPALRQTLPHLAGRMHDAPCDIPKSPAILLVDAPTAPVSSTGIRERLRNGENIEVMVPPGVAGYIRKHGLYRDPTSKDVE
jgi:nicotinate-nucleotide adenylyltransferase